jgi:hypothetical protein
MNIYRITRLDRPAVDERAGHVIIASDELKARRAAAALALDEDGLIWFDDLRTSLALIGTTQGAITVLDGVVLSDTR